MASADKDMGQLGFKSLRGRGNGSSTVGSGCHILIKKYTQELGTGTRYRMGVEVVKLFCIFTMVVTQLYAFTICQNLQNQRGQIFGCANFTLILKMRG